MGRDDNKPIGLTGSTGALPIWSELMKQISTQPVNLTPPDNITFARVDPNRGLLINPDCGSGRQYPYIAGSEPITYSECRLGYFNPDNNTPTDVFEPDPNINNPEKQ